MKYLSPILSQASGSLGGATAAKNRGGNYFRARVAPVQPRTVPQQEQRANLAALAGAWKILTSAQIAGWNALAAGITLTDAIGNSYKPTGEQLYVGNNRNLSQIAATSIEAPPTAKPDFPDPTPITLAGTAATPTLTLATSLAAAPTGYAFLVRATPQISPGISFIGGSKYRIIGSYAATTFTSMNLLTKYTAKFGALVVGGQIAVSLQLVNIATGFASTSATSRVTIAT